jgi:hypothetical protein
MAPISGPPRPQRLDEPHETHPEYNTAGEEQQKVHRADVGRSPLGSHEGNYHRDHEHRRVTSHRRFHPRFVRQRHDEETAGADQQLGCIRWSGSAGGDEGRAKPQHYRQGRVEMSIPPGESGSPHAPEYTDEPEITQAA